MSARSVTHRGVRLAAATCALLLLAAAGCGDGDRSAPPSPTSASTPAGPASPSPRPTPDDGPTVIATGLHIPWAVAFLPDQSALVTERTGRIVQVGPERGEDGRLTVREVQTIDDVAAVGEGGLLGIAVSPRYETDGLIYVYYTTERDNRIARLRLGEEPEPILTGIPRAGNHNGGRLGFGPDGYLYATTGDAGQREQSQDRDSLGGKVLRMTPDGDPAPGNPFGTLVWAYGLRNPQGLAWDDQDRLWVTEFGQDQWDEVNLIQPGGNYGWPVVEGEADDDRFIDPVAVWRPADASCSGAAVVDGTLYVGCLRGQRLWALRLTDAGTVAGAPEPLLVEEYGRLRAVVVASDGSLWVTTSNLDGRLRRDPDPDDDRIIRLGVGGGAGRL